MVSRFDKSNCVGSSCFGFVPFRTWEMQSGEDRSHCSVLPGNRLLREGLCCLVWIELRPNPDESRHPQQGESTPLWSIWHNPDGAVPKWATLEMDFVDESYKGMKNCAGRESGELRSWYCLVLPGREVATFQTRTKWRSWSEADRTGWRRQFCWPVQGYGPGSMRDGPQWGARRRLRR